MGDVPLEVSYADGSTVSLTLPCGDIDSVSVDGVEFERRGETRISSISWMDTYGRLYYRHTCTACGYMSELSECDWAFCPKCGRRSV